ncbi:hypothetical protein KEM54_006600 [Ascosphaera aggregata]|nr:hypothetical protein KEM54_006600 [Ascosphaera aggregata]
MSSRTPRIIRRPRRLLVLTPDTDAHTTIPPLLQWLTGHAVQKLGTTAAELPSQNRSQDECNAANQDEVKNHRVPLFTDSYAGYVSHPPLCIRTKFYSADIPIWVDEIPLSSALTLSSEQSTPTSEDPHGKRRAERKLWSSSITCINESSSLREWKDMFLGSDAQEVRDAIGAIVICLLQPSDRVRSDSVPTEALPADAQIKQKIYEVVYKEAIRAIADVKAKIEEERECTGGEVPGVLIIMEKHVGDETKTPDGRGITQSSTSDIHNVDETSERSAPFSSDWWEEELSQMGIFELEAIGWDGSPSLPTIPGNEKGKRNQFGELTGMERALQILEVHEWESTPIEDADDSDNSDGEDRNEDEKQKRRQSQRNSVIAGLLGRDSVEDSDTQTAFDADMRGLDFEMANLHMSLMDSVGHEDYRDDDQHLSDHGTHDVVGEDVQVEQFEGLMQRLQSLRDMNTSDLPYEERKRLARKAVEDIMRTI